MNLTIIGVPTSAGAYGIGQDRAPQALRDAGLIDALTNAGHDVQDAGDTPPARFAPDPTRPTAQNLARVVDVARTVRGVVANTLADGRIPLLLGGDCTITLGVVAGVLDHHPDAHLAYLDGDIDLSTPAATRSGILDAMVIAHLLDIDGVAPELATIGASRPLLPGSRVALIGHERDLLDDADVALLRQHDTLMVDANDLRRTLDDALTPALDRLDAHPRIVHFDVDAVDSTDLPLAEFPHFNTGLSLNDATQILRHLCRPDPVALVVTEANPDHDHDGHQIQRLVNAITIALNR